MLVCWYAGMVGRWCVLVCSCGWSVRTQQGIYIQCYLAMLFEYTLIRNMKIERCVPTCTGHVHFLYILFISTLDYCWIIVVWSFSTNSWRTAKVNPFCVWGNSLLYHWIRRIDIQHLHIWFFQYNDLRKCISNSLLFESQFYRFLLKSVTWNACTNFYPCINCYEIFHFQMRQSNRSLIVHFSYEYHHLIVSTLLFKHVNYYYALYYIDINHDVWVQHIPVFDFHCDICLALWTVFISFKVTRIMFFAILASHHK